MVNWNIEWMNDWYVNGSAVAFKQNNPNKGITDVDALATRVAEVIKSFNADIITIEEGPSSILEMHLFVDSYLQDNNGNVMFNVLGGLDGGAQKLYALIKKNGNFKNGDLANDDQTKALADEWEADVDGDFELEGYGFTREPLVITGKFGNPEKDLRIIILHTKSKYVHYGKSLWNNPNKKVEFVKAALKNRRRISTEAMRVRQYLNQIMQQDPNSNVIVTGDFNDGPGTDYFEGRYLTHNITDILLGSTYKPNLLFKHSFLEIVPSDKLYTAIFDDFVDNINGRKILLDHILTSPSLIGNIQNSGILHDEYNDGIDQTEQGRQKEPSDHIPVFVEIG